MTKTKLFYEREGKSFWRCAWCDRERDGSELGGSYVQVANVVVAIVCTAGCEEPAGKALLGALRRHAESEKLGATP